MSAPGLVQLIVSFVEPATAEACRGFLCPALRLAGDTAGALYVLAMIGLSAYGFNSLLLSALFLWYRRSKPVASDQWSVTRCQSSGKSGLPTADCRLPTVTVQLPIFNERYVVERLIDAACALDYPGDRLEIQVLDDSTDETTALARARVAYHRARGKNIALLHRDERNGFKAGALAAGLAGAGGEFVAVFDADFVPPPDFLRRTLPHFGDPQVGMVQARWGHLNADHNALTRAQAIMLDGHFIVEQTARSQAGLFFNFNGSAGVWRKACVEDAGGWRGDTIAEDLDLSYRAQLRGWQLAYVPEVVAPAEIPAQIMALKRQQFRWAKGSIQCLRYLWRDLLSAPGPWFRRVEGLLHLSTYLTHPMMMIVVLTSLPVIISGEIRHLPLGILSLAGLGPPVLFALSQWTTYPDAGKRFRYFWLLAFLGAGLAVNNTWAAVEAFTGAANMFNRTPKFRSEGSRNRVDASDYLLPIDWTTWVELTLAVYALIATGAALLYNVPALAPFLMLYGIGFSYVAAVGLLQSGQLVRPGGRRSLALFR